MFLLAPFQCWVWNMGKAVTTMDKKLTDKEIVKALECHRHIGKETCDSCPLQGIGMCSFVLINEVYNRFNHLQAENEDIKFLYENLKEEHLEIIKAIKHTKAEAYKEFAERLKKQINNELDEYWNSNGGGYYLAEDVLPDIDFLLEELVGEEK